MEPKRQVCVFELQSVAVLALCAECCRAPGNRWLLYCKHNCVCSQHFHFVPTAGYPSGSFDAAPALLCRQHGTPVARTCTAAYLNCCLSASAMHACTVMPLLEVYRRRRALSVAAPHHGSLKQPMWLPACVEGGRRGAVQQGGVYSGCTAASVGRNKAYCGGQ